mgnify:CR=1 FL=1
MSVTVGIINYNNQDFIARAIVSALDQGAEVIVADDCSTDNSVEIARDLPVRVITHDDNSGNAVRGWNDVLDAATGERVIFMSSDDALAPGAIARIEASSADWVYGDLLLVDADDKPLDEWRYPGWPTDPVTALARCISTHSIPVTMFAGFRIEWLRANRLRAVGFPEYRLAADTATCIRWLKAWPVIQYVPEVMFRYRQHGGQETRAINADRSLLADAIEAFYAAEFDYRTIETLRGML